MIFYFNVNCGTSVNKKSIKKGPKLNNQFNTKGVQIEIDLKDEITLIVWLFDHDEKLIKDERLKLVSCLMVVMNFTDTAPTKMRKVDMKIRVERIGEDTT